jgi:transposase
MRRIKCKITGEVKQESLEFLSKVNGYTKRFAYYVGKRCQSASISSVAKELLLDWKTVKELEKEYLEYKLSTVDNSNPKVIGIDEISIGKGHSYKIVVSDLENKRAIWIGGEDRSLESMDLFYNSITKEKLADIRLAVMDMWKPFRNSTLKNACNADILFDKFHIIRQLQKALDTVRKSEYSRLTGENRKFIKGQKYTLLSHKENLNSDGKKSLKILLNANSRLNKAYILKETFNQLWDYKSEIWARKFFDNWKKSLKWQRLKPYEKFAKMIETHWDGIASHCKPENKVSLGFVEGLNNKIRTIQKRAYGICDEEYLRLKVLTCMIPDL